MGSNQYDWYLGKRASGDMDMQSQGDEHIRENNHVNMKVIIYKPRSEARYRSFLHDTEKELTLPTPWFWTSPPTPSPILKY